MKAFFYPLLLVLVYTSCAFGVAITSPTNGQDVSSPFTLKASSATCSSQPVTTIGYSMDSGATTLFTGKSSINTQVSTSAGAHTVYVKVWNAKGGVCTTSAAITVASESNSSSTSSNVTINSPSSGQHVTSPFTLSASAATCSSHQVSTLGYSLDSGDTTMLSGKTSIDTSVSASVGSHTVHVKSWNVNGSVCVADVKIDVTSALDDVSADTSVVPASAVSVSNLESTTAWIATNDSGAGGSSSGKSSLAGSPSHSGSSREFVTTYKDYGAERYTVTFGDDRTSTNFMWDGWVYLNSSVSHIDNLEMDLNQTMPNGDTVIFGVQCDSPSGTWDYTENLGSAAKPSGHWAHSKAACNLHNWSTGTWHHVQMEYSRTDAGKVTYQYVWLDGVKSTLNATVFAARALGWGSSLSINFQVDGNSGSGTTTVYLDSLTLYRW
jgi:hypothetical protein